MKWILESLKNDLRSDFLNTVVCLLILVFFSTIAALILVVIPFSQAPLGAFIFYLAFASIITGLYLWSHKGD